MKKVWEDDREIEEPILNTDPCVECGEGFTADEWMRVHSYGARGDVHDHCCRDPQCDEDGCE